MAFPPLFCTGKKTVNVIVETPRGSNTKFTYDHESELFKLGKILPAGTVFPVHFGFLPHTCAADGDPLDAIVLMDAPSFPGIFIECRVVGVMQITQQLKKGQAFRNDRIITVATADKSKAAIQSPNDLPPQFLNELNSFFEYYTQMAGKKYELLGINGAEAAIKIIHSNVE